MNKIILNFEFSPELEIKRVENTLAKIDWYKSNGYSPTMPNDLININQSVNNEYSENAFIAIKKQIEKEWENYKLNFPQKLQSIKLTRQPIYRIQLTKYGVRGSYNLPDLIILNIGDRDVKNLTRTIVHEIIHLTIEKWIQECNILHWQKERLIDLIFDQIYPELNKMRDLKENSDVVDKVFIKKFPNIKQIIENI